MTRIAGAMADALSRGRERFNARFAAARMGGAAIDGESFLVHLGNVVSPVIDAVATEMPERADGTLTTLFDVSLELFAASLLGSQGKSRYVGEVWSRLLPVAAKLVMRDPQTVAAALSNAAYNLERTAARPGEWIEQMIALAPACHDVRELLEAGKVAAWRAGMPHYREGALASAKSLRPELAGAILDVPPDELTAVLDGMSADPWLTPAAAARRGSGTSIRLVAQLGAFRGFGGEFLYPPTVVASGQSLFVIDGDSSWRLICDCYGRLLIRHARPAQIDPPHAELRVSANGGAVQWPGGARVVIPELNSAAAHAFDGRTLAVTLRDSHHVLLVARAPEPEAADG